MKGAHGFLLLRRGGGVWGVSNAVVHGLVRQDGVYRVTLEARQEGAPGAPPASPADAAAPATLWADEVVGVVADLAVRPLSPVVRSFWPEESVGCAVWGQVPLVVVDPWCPPRVLTLE